MLVDKCKIKLSKLKNDLGGSHIYINADITIDKKYKEGVSKMP